MARRMITLDEKIRMAETTVAAAKAKYDTPLPKISMMITILINGRIKEG